MIIISVCFALLITLVITCLIVFAILQHPPQDCEADLPFKTLPDPDWMKTLYTTTTSLYIEVDREIWQIATIFLAASLGVLGWVVISFEKLNLYLVIVLGCASIILVGIATLFKHRLREFNLVHLAFLRRIEQSISETQDDAEFWGLHHIRRIKLMSKGSFCKTILSIHGLMDIYYFFFIILWLAIWIVAFSVK